MTTGQQRQVGSQVVVGKNVARSDHGIGDAPQKSVAVDDSVRSYTPDLNNVQTRSENNNLFPFIAAFGLLRGKLAA